MLMLKHQTTDDRINRVYCGCEIKGKFKLSPTLDSLIVLIKAVTDHTYSLIQVLLESSLIMLQLLTNMLLSVNTLLIHSILTI